MWLWEQQLQRLAAVCGSCNSSRNSAQELQLQRLGALLERSVVVKAATEGLLCFCQQQNNARERSVAAEAAGSQPGRKVTVESAAAKVEMPEMPKTRIEHLFNPLFYFIYIYICIYIYMCVYIVIATLVRNNSPW